VSGTVYDLNPRKLGYFDIVLFCGVLYHLRYPLLGIDNIRRVCKGEVYTETVVSDAMVLVREGEASKLMHMDELSPKLLSVPLWQFYRGKELNDDPSNWFGPNCEAGVQAFEAAGFETQLLKNWGRATFRGKLKQGPPEFLSIGSGEGVFYDTITSPVLGNDELAGAAAAGTNGRGFIERILNAVLASREYYKRSGKRDDAWIRSLYVHLLGRDTSGGGTEERFRDLFDDDQAYRQAVVDHLLTSTEYRLQRIHSYYTTYLGRPPLAHENGYWLAMFQRGASQESIQAEFLGSEEYFNNHGADHRQWLDRLYVQVMDKVTTHARDSYLEILDSQTATRVEIATAILESLEYRQRLIESICKKLLGRPATREEAARSLATLHGGVFRDGPASPWRRGLMRVFGRRRLRARRE